MFVERVGGDTERQGEEEEVPATSDSVCGWIPRCLLPEDATVTTSQSGLISLDTNASYISCHLTIVSLFLKYFFNIKSWHR